MLLDTYGSMASSSSQNAYTSHVTSTSSTFHLFGNSCIVPPSPSCSEHMSSPHNLISPSATPHATDNGCRGNFFQFPPATSSSTKDAWDATTTTSGTSNHHQQQHSPMAISPNLSTLNTPRGSIASIRSHPSSSHSPMAMLVDGSSSSSTTITASLHQQQHQPHHYSVPPPYLTDSASVGSGPATAPAPEFSFHDLSTTYPSPPRSGYNSPVPPSAADGGLFDPPSYGQHLEMAAAAVYGGDHQTQLQQQHPDVHPSSAFDTTQFTDCLPLYALAKAEEDEDEYAYATAASPASLHHYNKSLDFYGSDATSSSHPETPDSSVKEEPDCAPTPTSWSCLWAECGMGDFSSQRALVEHVNESHMDAKKGCDELPCLWMDCPRKLTPFNAKYKLLTHMRVHTKEKPYPCEFEGCTRAFARLENRKIHLRSHTGDKPFGCKYAQEFKCTKRFSNSSDRAKHEQTHKDPKPYRCEVVGCTKRYTDPSSLRKHVKSHTLDEQLQYRRSKDQANAAKRSSSPFGQAQTPLAVAPAPSPIATWNSRQQAQPTPTNSSSQFSASSSTLLGLQSGGTCILEEVARPQSRVLMVASPGTGVSSPLHQMLRGSVETEKLSSRVGKGGVSYGGSGQLAHQPNSLDDLDGETLPFDDVPIRYDSSANFDLPAEWATSESDPNL